MCTMYKKNAQRNVSNENKAGYLGMLEEEQLPRSDLLNIWRVNPSFKHIIQKRVTLKNFLITLIFIVLSFSSLYLFRNILLSIGISIIGITSLFFEQMVNGYKILITTFQEIIRVDPFEHFKICKLADDPASLLIINKKTATNVIIRVFKVEVLPENVQPTLNQFVKALNNSQLGFSYQIVQQPMITVTKNDKKDGENLKIDEYQSVDSSESFKTSIYFSVYYHLDGALSKTKKRNLIETIEEYSEILKNNFSANFHHTKITPLSGNNLINAIRTLSYHQIADIPLTKEDNLKEEGFLTRTLAKMIIGSTLLVYISLVLLGLNFHILIVLIIDCLGIAFFIFVWWRDVLFVFTRKYIKRSKNISVIKLFADVEFYRLKSYKDVLFLNIQSRVLTAFSILNLRSSIQPTLAYPDKFFRALNNHQIPYIYNLCASPISSGLFVKECSRSLNEKTVDELNGIIFHTLDGEGRKVKHRKIEFDNWLQMRAGIWETTLTITPISYKYIHELKIEDLFELGAEVASKIKITKNAFESNHFKMRLGVLNKRRRDNGFISICLKNLSFNFTGTGLNYLYFQGKNLIHLTKISGEHKKGLDTKIAAEFNTPIHLTNHAIIGKTVNTEFLEAEKPLGFTFNQYKSLFITNGLTQERETAKMKVAAELITNQFHCVIFDFTGDWSKLIRYFENTIYKDNFLHFKLGTTFNVNLSKSGIKYEKKNIDYLSLFYDAFALAYKEQKITIEALKKSINKEPNLDLNPLLLDYKYDTEYKPYNKDNRLLNLLNELTNQTIVISEESFEFEENINPIDFVKNDKSIIIDLSILKDLENKTFISFVILSKIIHYINNLPDYIEKMIFIPHVDAFFDANYIDSYHTTGNYGKIGKFLDPLRKHGFGLIFSANQIKYLHPNFLNYFRNIISFRATDSKDIAILKNQMNLQELQGAGYYSSSRNNTYQIDYLKNLRDNDVIVKRADINQPFPGVIDYDWFSNSLHLTHDKIIEYMEHQGYNLKRAERKIMEQAKKTLFEKDFGMFSHFLTEIINFLKNIKIIDKVGQMYKGKLKEELLKSINESAAKRNYNKKQIKELRDELFETLVKHGYLVENHPKRASGSESMRTSYAVGAKYEVALKDYYDSQDSSDIIYEPIEVESEPTEVESEPIETKSELKDDLEDFDPIKLRNALKKHFAPILYYEYFLMYKDMKYNKYEKVVKNAQNLLPKFLYSLYIDYYGENYPLTSENRKKFVNLFGRVEGFPFTGDDIRQFLKNCKNIEVNDSTRLIETSQNIYDMYTTIFDGFSNYNERGEI